MVCKGTCNQYKARWKRQQLRYASGQKRCNVCELFVNWEGHNCPCCGMKLRTRSKISRYRRKCIIQTEKVLGVLK